MPRDARDVGLAIKRVQVLHHRRLERALGRVGLTLVQWDALRHLRANPGSSLHDLARLTFQSDQAMGTLAQRMVAAGLVERTAGPGRVVRLSMTPTGRRLVEQGSTVADEVFATTLGVLTPRQLDALGATLDRLLALD